MIKSLLGAYVFAIGLSMFLCGSKASAQETDRIIVAQISAKNSVRSLRARVHVTRTLTYDPIHDTPLPQPITDVTAFDWASKGDKLYLKGVISADKPSLKPVSDPNVSDEVYYDGRNMYSLMSQSVGSASQNRPVSSHYGTYQQGWSQQLLSIYCVNPLSFGYQLDERGPSVEDIWDGTVLQKSHRQIMGFKRDDMFGLLTIVRCDRKIGSVTEQVYYAFARNYNNIAVETEVRHPMLVDPAGYTRMLYHATKLRKFATVWIATRSELHGDRVFSNRTVPIFSETVNFDHINLNNVPDNLFTPVLPIGTILYNQGDGKRYKVAAANNELIMTATQYLPRRQMTPSASKLDPKQFIFWMSLFVLLGTGVAWLYVSHRNKVT